MFFKLTPVDKGWIKPTELAPGEAARGIGPVALSLVIRLDATNFVVQFYENSSLEHRNLEQVAKYSRSYERLSGKDQALTLVF